MIDRERHIDLRDINITHDPAVINAEKGFVFFPLLIRHDEARVTLLAQLRIICAGVLEHLLIISIINLRNLIGLLPAAVICTGGYYLASALMYGDFAAALSDVPTNLLQSAGSAALFVFLGLSLDRLSFKKRFSLTISSKSKKAV